MISISFINQGRMIKETDLSILLGLDTMRQALLLDEPTLDFTLSTGSDDLPRSICRLVLGRLLSLGVFPGDGDLWRDVSQMASVNRSPMSDDGLDRMRCLEIPQLEEGVE